MCWSDGVSLIYIYVSALLFTTIYVFLGLLLFVVVICLTASIMYVCIGGWMCTARLDKVIRGDDESCYIRVKVRNNSYIYNTVGNLPKYLY